MLVPVQLPVSHRSVVPEPPVADKLMLPASSAQKLLRSEAAEVGATGSALTVTVTLAQAALVQPVVVFRARA
jgi:hypothetical protein